MEFHELFNLDEINSVLEARRDPHRKELADRVTVNDFSSATHINGDPIDYESDDMAGFHTEFIVAATHENSIYDVQFTKYRQDLVIFNTQTDKLFRISSGHVTLK